MAELTKEDLQAKLQGCTASKEGCLKQIEEIKVKIETFVKDKQKEVDDFTAQQNALKDQIITQAVEYQGSIKTLEDLIKQQEV